MVFFPHFNSQPSMFQQMAATAGGVAVGSAIVSFDFPFKSPFLSTIIDFRLILI